MYKTKHFKLHELVPQHLYEKHGEACWELLDSRALQTIDALRDKFGSITINNYFWGGTRNWSGVRTEHFYSSVEAYLKTRSQHKYGRAFDCIVRDYTAKEVRKYIMDNPDEFPYITFLEADISWLHLDCRNCDRIKLWSPTRGYISSED